ncbi:hypothetical protein SUNI508_09802 [Seiridium unicorne]|uniref:Uncharacterized protein n=1 Tax=Seiridium unicorne TaxID=138068 RepID=A0ABR2UN12_9PEZI
MTFYATAKTMTRALGRDQSSLSSDDEETRLVYGSVEKFGYEQKRRKRPSIILATLCILFIASGGGIALAVILILDPVEVQGACLSRDLVLYAALLSLLYIGLHIRAASRDYIKTQPGPPHIYDNYLHASAILIARLSIFVWVCALIATAVMVATAFPLGGLAGKLPILNLLICIGALPSFIIISCTIERHQKPFATTGLSRPSLLTCRVSAFADDLVADESMSRRESVHWTGQRGGTAAPKASAGNVQSIRSDPTYFIRKPIVPGERYVREGRNPAMNIFAGKEPLGFAPGSLDKPKKAAQLFRPASPPQPVYYPGGWRREWNSLSIQLPGLGTLTNSSSGDSTEALTCSSSRHSKASKDTSGTSAPSSFAGKYKATTHCTTTNLAQRARPLISRHATEPYLAVKPLSSVSRERENMTAYSPATAFECDFELPNLQKPAFALLRNAQQAQQSTYADMKAPSDKDSRYIPGNS